MLRCLPTRNTPKFTPVLFFQKVYTGNSLKKPHGKELVGRSRFAGGDTRHQAVAWRPSRVLEIACFRVEANANIFK